MKRIDGNLEAMLTDTIVEVLTVMVRAAMGEFGPLPEEALSELSGAVGTAMATIQNRIEAGGYS